MIDYLSLILTDVSAVSPSDSTSRLAPSALAGLFLPLPALLPTRLLLLLSITLLPALLPSLSESTAIGSVAATHIHNHRN